jgi:hypothetical protein
LNPFRTGGIIQNIIYSKLYNDERETMSTLKNQLMSKNGWNTVQLAREMLTHFEGDRIETVGWYAEKLGTGRGTVQAALKFLQTAGAIRLESRGHLGTTIQSLNYKQLWEIADLGAVTAVMPLPYSKRYEGLATGLYKAFETADIPFSLAFMRGANKRMEAVRLGRYHFTVISKLAAEAEANSASGFRIIHQFSAGSYVGNHVVIFRDGHDAAIRDGMRVALDSSSLDQYLLTRSECAGKEVTYVETSYAQILSKLKNNEIDAAIWNEDEIREKNLDFKVAPLQNATALGIRSDDTTAVIVVSEESSKFEAILKRFVDFQATEAIQKKVIRGELTPVY